MDYFIKYIMKYYNLKFYNNNKLNIKTNFE